MSNKRGKINTTTITQIALFSALQCVVSPFAIVFPFSPVPISLATLMLYLSVYVLGKNKSMISCGIYLLIGLVGLPVFSGFTGGLGKLMGPTGGYLIGYLLLVFISGWFVEKWNNYFMQGIGMVIGTVLCYFVGSFWLAYQSQLNMKTALLSGMLPFLPGDVIKIVCGVLIGTAVRKRLRLAGMLE